MESEDLPEEFAFTVRVNASTNPALARALWNLPWGSRGRIAVELMTLGLAARAGDVTASHPLLAQPLHRKAPARKPGRAKKAPASPPASAPVPPIALGHTPVPKVDHQFQPQVPTLAPGPAALPAPPPPSAGLLGSPTVQAPVEPAAEVSHAHTPEPRPPSSALSSLLGQFDDD